MREFIGLMFQFIFMVFGMGASIMVLHYIASGNLVDGGLFLLMTACLFVLSFTASPDL
jgi:hypothetical protein